MSRRSNTGGLALLITILALLVYAYFAFMGAEYMFYGRHIVVAPLCVTGTVALAGCVWLACRSKQSRNKHKALAVEVATLLGAAAILWAGQKPFALFVHLASNGTAVSSLVAQARNAAGGVDTAYVAYAGKRIDDYAKRLNEKHDAVSANHRKTSLERRLLPDNLETLQSERRQWLSTLEGASVMNIATARNIDYLVNASALWESEYAQVSATIYDDEPDTAMPFSYGEANDAVVQQYSSLIGYDGTDSVSLISTLACCLMIAVYYFYSHRPESRVLSAKH